MIVFLVIFIVIFFFIDKYYFEILLRFEFCREFWLRIQYFFLYELINDKLGFFYNVFEYFIEFWYFRVESWFSCVIFFLVFLEYIIKLLGYFFLLCLDVDLEFFLIQQFFYFRIKKIEIQKDVVLIIRVSMLE